MPKLLKRDVFRETILARAGGVCCVPGCGFDAVDAHHILNRNLFVESEEFGGYFIENGAQLCSKHHYEAELTLISTEELREWCGVSLVLPVGWSTEKSYDTWGNEVVTSYARKPGPLFHDKGFQKVLKIANLSWQFQQ